MCLRGYPNENRLPKNLLVLFFSSRRRHTRYWRDWSSDVCSSDLDPGERDTPFSACHRCRATQDNKPAILLGGNREKNRVLVGRRFGSCGGRRAGAGRDRERGGEGKRVDLGGRRIIKKKKKKRGVT